MPLDILGPVQWSAGKNGYGEWKKASAGRIALWGGGVNTQRTLPLGTVADVEREVGEVVPCMAAGGGYVFCAIHNILAEIVPKSGCHVSDGCRACGVAIDVESCVHN